MMNIGRIILRNERAKSCSTVPRDGKNCCRFGGGKAAAALFAETLSPQKPASRCIPQPERIAGKSWYTRNVTKKSTA